MANLYSNQALSLPLVGKSRWSTVSKFSPISRETFRKLSNQGRAPQPERLGIRCTFYDNAEVHRWLSDPVNYRVDQPNLTPIAPVDADECFNVIEKTVKKQEQKKKPKDAILETDSDGA